MWGKSFTDLRSGVLSSGRIVQLCERVTALRDTDISSTMCSSPPRSASTLRVTATSPTIWARSESAATRNTKRKQYFFMGRIVYFLELNR